MIPGLCIVWCQRKGEPYWTRMSYQPRGYESCEQLVDIYEEEWGTHYFYKITAASDLCRPVGYHPGQQPVS
jgi:hypothetical protein